MPKFRGRSGQQSARRVSGQSLKNVNQVDYIRQSCSHPDEKYRYSPGQIMLSVMIPSSASEEREAWDEFCDEWDMPMSVFLRRGFRLLVETVRRYPTSDLARDLVQPAARSVFDGPVYGNPQWTEHRAVWAGFGYGLGKEKP